VRLLFYILFALILAVVAGILLKQDASQVIFALSDYSIQITLSFFVLLLFASFFLFYYLIRSLSGMLDIPKNYRRWKKTRGHTKSEYYLTQGNLSLIEGNWVRAEKLLSKGAKYSRLPLINYIGAARAAQNLGALERRDSYLRQAYAEDSASGNAVGLTRAELQLNQQQTEQAYATLQHINNDKPGQNQVNLMMLEASSELNDWHQSLKILQALEKKGAMPVEKIRAKQLHAYANIITTVGGTSTLNELKDIWQTVPKKLKKEFYLLEVYIKARLKFPDTSDCEVMIRRVIRHSSDPVLVRLYGLVNGQNPAKQLSYIELLMKENPGDSNILLTAGTLYKRAELWGKARSCIEKSIALVPTAEAYYELATLFETQGDSENSKTNFQKGLALVANPIVAIAPKLPSSTIENLTKQID
jgi:HemY protein